MLWVVRAQVALSTIFRLTRLRNAVSVPGMAVCTGTQTPIRVNSTHPGVGPTLQLTARLCKYETAVTSNAAEVNIVMVIFRVIQQPYLLQDAAIGKQRRQSSLRPTPYTRKGPLPYPSRIERHSLFGSALASDPGN